MWWRQPTPLGDVVVVTNERGVLRLTLPAPLVDVESGVSSGSGRPRRPLPAPLVDVASGVSSGSGRPRRPLPVAHGVTVLDEPPERDDTIATELDEYFAATRRTFTASLDLSYADADRFPRRVLETLARDVLWGETVTYGELADMAGAPRAARAVGNVMAHNPVQLLIPCHRVVASNGIGGYGAAGVGLKRALLELEGVHVP